MLLPYLAFSTIAGEYRGQDVEDSGDEDTPTTTPLLHHHHHHNDYNNNDSSSDDDIDDEEEGKLNLENPPLPPLTN